MCCCRDSVWLVTSRCRASIHAAAAQDAYTSTCWLQVIDDDVTSRLSPPLSPDPTVLIVDLESAAISAVRHGYTVEVRGCFFHLTKSSWRKVQALGLAAPYKADEDVRLFCGMLDAL